MIKIVHIITSLSTGGAEMMLYRLISNMDTSRFETYVISLTEGGDIKTKLESIGIKTYSLNMKKNFNIINCIIEIRKIIKNFKPDIVQGWMYHGNFIAQIACLGYGNKTPVLWNITHSLDSFATEKTSIASLIRIGAFLSEKPSKIIYCSNSSARQHESIGYKRLKTVIIPNGFNCNIFKPDDVSSMAIRADLGFSKRDIVIGLVARYHPVKDHQNFLYAASLLTKEYPNLKILMAGRQINKENNVIVNLIKKLGLEDQVYLLGERSDVPRIINGLDILVSSSYTEAFPITIGEAMACGIPCVATNVGDCEYIIGETGYVAPPRDSAALARAIKAMIGIGQTERNKLGTMARDRIIKNFSLESIIRCYEDIYTGIVDSPR